MKNKAILCLAILSGSVIASENNPFEPYAYIEVESTTCSDTDKGEDLDDLKDVLSSSTEGLDFIMEANGIEIYYDPKNDKYVEINNEQK